MSRPARWPVRVKRGNSNLAIYRIRSKKNGRTYTEFKLAFYDELGKRKFQSFSTFKRAREAADNVNIGLMKGEIKSLMLSNDDKVVYLRAIKALEPTGTSLDMAAHQFAEAAKLLGGASLLEAARDYLTRHPAKLPRKSVEEVVQEFIEDRRQAKRSEDHLRDLRYRLNRFKAAFPTSLADVTRSDVLRFLTTLELSPCSQYNFLKVLKVFFEFAKSRGYLPKEHAELEGLQVGNNDPGEIEIFTPAEMTQLLSAAQPELVPFLAIAGFAGLRSKELERLDWSEVQLGRGFIELKRSKTKTSRRRLVPIQLNLARWLKPYAKESGPVWVYSSANLSKVKSEVAEDAEVEWKHNALRHSFASYRLAQTQNANQVSLETGHSVSVLFTNYRELVTPDQAKAWFEIVPEEIGPVEIYTPEEMKALLSAAANEVISALALCGFSGLSQGEVEGLDWSEIDFESGVIELKKTKSKDKPARVVPILANLAEWLRPHANGRSPVLKGSIGTLSEALQQTAEQAGIEWKERGLDHSYACYRLAQIQDAQQVGQETGYTPHAIFAAFEERVTRDDAQCWFSMPSVGGNNPAVMPLLETSQSVN